MSKERSHSIIEEDGKKIMLTPGGNKILLKSEMSPVQQQGPTPEEDFQRRMVDERINRQGIITTLDLFRTVDMMMFERNPGIEEMIAQSSDPIRTHSEQLIRFMETVGEVQVIHETNQTRLAQQDAQQAFFKSVEHALNSRVGYMFAPKDVRTLVDTLRSEMGAVLITQLASQVDPEQIQLGVRNLGLATEAQKNAEVARLTIGAMVKAEERIVAAKAKAEEESLLIRSKSARDQAEIENRRESSLARREGMAGYADVVIEKSGGAFKEAGNVAESWGKNVSNVFVNFGESFRKIFADRENGLVPGIADAFSNFVANVSVPVVGGAAIGGTLGAGAGLIIGANFLSPMLSIAPELSNPVVLLPAVGLGLGVGVIGGAIGKLISDR